LIINENPKTPKPHCFYQMSEFHNELAEFPMKPKEIRKTKSVIIRMIVPETIRNKIH
jgi:hypothetical protein